MKKNLYIPLLSRGILQISGPDARAFLQGIITNDICKVTPERAIYACMLTPQGKFLFDFFICQSGEALWLDCAFCRIEDLKKRFIMYKLRSKVEISDISGNHEVVSLIGKAPEIDMLFADPRTEKMGFRTIVPRGKAMPEGYAMGTSDDYERLRIALRVPDGEKDLIPDKHFPLHFRMEELHAIDYGKGCYVGQEVTSRTKHLGVIRKSIYVVESGASLPSSGAPVTSEGKAVGELRSSIGALGLALLEVEAAEAGKSLMSGNNVLRITDKA